MQSALPVELLEGDDPTRWRPGRCDGSQTFFEWCLTVTPGACSKTAPTLLPLGFFGAVFFGFLGSRPDRFCPFAIVASNRDCLWMMMRYSQIKWLVPAYLRADAGEQSRVSRL